MRTEPPVLRSILTSLVENAFRCLAATMLCRLWYSSQYLLGASTRFATAGEYVAARKTAPAINSAWIFGSEHNAFTLDYNAVRNHSTDLDCWCPRSSLLICVLMILFALQEATFYGVASSNRPELVYSYVTLVMGTLDDVHYVPLQSASS